MIKAHIAQPFVWRDGQTNVLVEQGEQLLTPEQLAHAEKHGFIRRPAPSKKNTPAPEVTENEQS